MILKYIIKWIAIFAISILGIVGLLTFYEVVVGDGEIPAPRFVGFGTKESNLVSKTSEVYIRSDSNESDWWKNLEETFVLMDKVVPHVSCWLREQKRRGKVVLERKMGTTYARYDVISDKLTINVGMMNRSNGFKCTIFAHEWRHSRQNHGKWGKSLLAYVLTGENQEDIIENDAYMYQFLVEKEMQPFFTRRK